MKIVAIILVSLICVSGLVFVAYFVGVTSDDRRIEIARETALIHADAEREAIRADGQVKILQARERLAKVELRTDPAVKESLIRALKIRAILSAWFPLYAPVLLFAGVSSCAAVYFSFRLVVFKHDGLESPVRAFDAARLVERSLQVKALEATQGVDVLQLAEAISHRQLSAFGQMARGFRGMLGKVEVTERGRQAALPEMNESPLYVPSFQQAVNDMKPGHVLIGYDNENKSVQFPINQFVSCALAGGSGSGKTTKERFFVSQMAVNGVRVHILDAHAGDPQSLVNSLGDICKLPNVTTHSPIETRDTIRFFLHDLEEAKKHPEQKETTIYVIDELLPIIDAVPETSDFILKVATEGRKYERFGMISGQVWPASLFAKGSSVRDALMLKMSAKLPLEQARILFKSKEKAQTVERLRLPEMYATSMQYSGVVTVPFCSREDMNALAARVLPQETPAQAARTPEPTPPAAECEIDTLTDAQLIGRVNLKKGMVGNNEFARMIGQDEGLTSKSLRGLSMPLFPAMRNAFKQFLKTA